MRETLASLEAVVQTAVYTDLRIVIFTFPRTAVVEGDRMRYSKP